jgi:hypothetical protein
MASPPSVSSGRLGATSISAWPFSREIRDAMYSLAPKERTIRATRLDVWIRRPA